MSSPVVVRGRSYSSSESTASSSPKIGSSDRNTFDAPRVEIGAPCIKCGSKCPGLLLHVWRKICINCRCPREAHQATLSPTSHLARLTLENLPDYCWKPQAASDEMVKMYMDSLPYGHAPIKGTDGELKRNKLYQMQMPPQDSYPDLCSKLSEVEQKRLLKVAEKNKSRACGVGNLRMAVKKEKKVCSQCEYMIQPGSVYISAGRAPANQAWHPACFQCTKCSSLLVDLIYYYHSDTKQIYCGRHYAELKIPRCAGCDELIFADTYTQAEGKNWHKSHFCCAKCDKQLQGSKYGCDKDIVFCQDCYNRHAAEDCSRCHLTILLGEKKVRKEGLVFHEECFVCKRCKESFFDRDHFVSENDLLCSECIQPIAQCSSCKLGILPTAQHLKYESKAWHLECFLCKSCNKSLVDMPFHEYDGYLFCQDCYKIKVSKRCTRCHNPVSGRGVQYGFVVYHPECFICTHCGTNLNEEKVHEKNGNLYCSACILKLAKKCYGCQGPITSKHTVYKKKTYHLDCFKCTKCNRPIGNKSFYETSLNDLLCERCASHQQSNIYI